MPDTLRAAAEKALAYICNVNTAEPQEVIDALCQALGLDEHYRVDELAAPLVKPVRVVALVQHFEVLAARADAPVAFGVIDLDVLDPEKSREEEAAFDELPFDVMGESSDED
jgi:hypothetical protein